MEPRRTSVRRAGLVGIALALIVGASACSGASVGPAPAATVNGTDISQKTLDQMVKGYSALIKAEGKAVIANLSQPSADGTPAATGAQLASQTASVEAQIKQLGAKVDKSGDTYPTEGAASMLTELIKREVIAQAVDAAGAKITADDRAKALQSVESSYPTVDKASKLVRTTFVESAAGLMALQSHAPKKYQDALAAASAQYEAQLKSIYEQQIDSFNQVCARLIGTKDEASAKAAKARIEGGEDFVTVAKDVSVVDAAAATTAQCYAADQINQAFGTTAKAGDLLGPIANGGNWALLAVDEVKPQTFEAARSTIAQQVTDQYTAAAQAALSTYIGKQLVKAADVTVDPRFGTWDDKTLSVTAPKVPAPVTPAEIAKAKAAAKAAATTTVPAAAGS
ncbi:peptidyl-prolyl cis-trans isomerase [Aquihabitans sp. McL0605]|uniref:peptidylprolyl isomerase n=1 Tax=Aquihabitans sp. McL0605 TaxID=3415671 RepID=UPI003CF22417